MMTNSLIIDDLRSVISKSKGSKYVETRYQSRITNEVIFSNGELEMIRTVQNSGCGGLEFWLMVAGVLVAPMICQGQN